MTGVDFLLFFICSVSAILMGAFIEKEEKEPLCSKKKDYYFWLTALMFVIWGTSSGFLCTNSKECDEHSVSYKQGAIDHSQGKVEVTCTVDSVWYVNGVKQEKH